MQVNIETPHRADESRALASFEDGLAIVTFAPAYRDDFKRLNLAWLTRYFTVEPVDERVLGSPEAEILAPGGEILFAVRNGEVIGAVALKVEGADEFELTKMAVAEAWQGRGYGLRLLEAACRLAKARGARRVVLYSQRSLRAAVSMYFKYGFVELQEIGSRYSRCDIKMELTLD